jgi:hypothetical protein
MSRRNEMTKEQELLIALLLDYLDADQSKVRRSGAACEAFIHLAKAMGVDALDEAIEKVKEKRK